MLTRGVNERLVITVSALDECFEAFRASRGRGTWLSQRRTGTGRPLPKAQAHPYARRRAGPASNEFEVLPTETLDRCVHGGSKGHRVLAEGGAQASN